MAVYPPPNFTETITTFNTSNWNEDYIDITPAYLRKNYLKFPVAQGTETLVNTIVNGDLSINQKIVYPNGSTQNTAPVINPITISNNFNLTTNIFGARSILNSSTVPVDKNTFRTINLPLSVDSIYNKSSITLFNNGLINILLTTSPGQVVADRKFLGIYGNDSTNIILPVNNELTFYWDGGNYQVISNGKRSVYYQDTASDWSSFTQYNLIGDSTLVYRYSGANGLITLPSIDFNSLPNSKIEILNDSPNNLEIVSTEFFSGIYGTGLGKMILFSGQCCCLYPDYYTTDYKVEWLNQRKEITLSYTAFLGICAIEELYTYYNNDIILTGSGATTISTFPTVQQGNASPKRTRIYNNGSGDITLTIPAGAFTSIFSGTYGSGTSSLHIPAGLWVDLNANSTNWLVNTRSPDFVFIESIGTSVNYSANFSYLDSKLELTPSGDCTVSLIPATSCRSRSYNIFNRSVYNITLTNSEYIGVYGNNTGSGLTTTIIPPNSYLKLVSNGTRYICNERGEKAAFTYTILSGLSNTNQLFYIFNSTLTLQGGAGVLDGSLVEILLPTPSLLAHRTRIYNPTISPVNLTIGSGVFGGYYGNNTGSYILPAGGLIEVEGGFTNYLVNYRSASSLNILPVGTLNLTNDNSYCESDINIVAPDIGIAFSNCSGFASQSGQQNFVVSSITTGVINVGTVIIFTGGIRQVVLNQQTGTLGGVGTYTVSGVATVGAGTAFTGFSNPNSLSTGTFTQNATSRATLPPTYNISGISVGSGTLDIGTVISSSTGTNTTLYQYILDNINSGGTGVYKMTGRAASTDITSQVWFGTAGNKIILPPPSLATGRSFTFTNQNQLPVNITTTGGTDVFGGLWGQQTISTTTSQFVYSTNYLLRPGKTVKLVAIGNIWSAVSASSQTTTLSLSATTNTPTADNSYQVLASLVILDSRDFNTNGLSILGGARNRIYNNTGYPILISASASINWANSAVSSSAQLPQRTIKFDRPGLGTTLNISAAGQSIPGLSLPVVGAGGASQTFTITPASSAYNQLLFGTIIQLQPGEEFGISVSKVNSAATAETVSITSTVSLTRLC